MSEAKKEGLRQAIVKLTETKLVLENPNVFPDLKEKLAREECEKKQAEERISKEAALRKQKQMLEDKLNRIVEAIDSHFPDDFVIQSRNLAERGFYRTTAIMVSNSNSGSKYTSSDLSEQVMEAARRYNNLTEEMRRLLPSDILIRAWSQPTREFIELLRTLLKEPTEKPPESGYPEAAKQPTYGTEASRRENEQAEFSKLEGEEVAKMYTRRSPFNPDEIVPVETLQRFPLGEAIQTPEDNFKEWVHLRDDLLEARKEPQIIIHELSDAMAAYNKDFTKIYFDPLAWKELTRNEKYSVIQHEKFEYQKELEGWKPEPAHIAATKYERENAAKWGVDYKAYTRKYLSLLGRIRARGSKDPEDISPAVAMIHESALAEGIIQHPDEFIFRPVANLDNFLADHMRLMWISPNLGIQGLYGRLINESGTLRLIALFFYKSSGWDEDKIVNWAGENRVYISEVT